MLVPEGEGAPQVVPDLWGDFDLPLAVSRVSKEQEGVVARGGRDANPAAGGSPGILFVVRQVARRRAWRRVLVVARDLSEGRSLEERQQRFLADAVHELKTTFTTILGSAELLLDGDDEDPETRRRLLGHVRSQALRMRRLSESLLKLAKTGADIREPGLRDVPMCLLEEVAGKADPLVEEAGMELVVDDRWGRILADTEWLERALLILVSNAAKHSGEGQSRVAAGGRRHDHRGGRGRGDERGGPPTTSNGNIGEA